ncbi:MAG: hypothetical protein NT154_37710, partial [Verrucomicrobia bacterium]|nr:hypothetical protein [Verrucomicrobiota bacterium]
PSVIVICTVILWLTGRKRFPSTAATRASGGWRLSSQRFPHGGNQLVSNERLPKNLNGCQVLGDRQHGP